MSEKSSTDQTTTFVAVIVCLAVALLLTIGIGVVFLALRWVLGHCSINPFQSIFFNSSLLPGHSPSSTKSGLTLELITFEILADERLRLMGFDNRLIIDCFAGVVNILIWLFSTNERFRSEKYESIYLENPFPEIKGVNLLSKTHRNDKSNLRPMTVLQE